MLMSCRHWRSGWLGCVKLFFFSVSFFLDIFARSFSVPFTNHYEVEAFYQRHITYVLFFFFFFSHGLHIMSCFFSHSSPPLSSSSQLSICMPCCLPFPLARSAVACYQRFPIVHHDFLFSMFFFFHIESASWPAFKRYRNSNIQLFNITIHGITLLSFTLLP